MSNETQQTSDWKDRECTDCTYFQGDYVSGGICRRFPPQFSGLSDNGEDNNYDHPIVSRFGTYTCGEFQDEK